MESESSLPHFQVHHNCPCPEPVRHSPYPPSHFLKLHFNIILTSTPGPPKWFSSSGFPTKILCTFLLFPLHATCPAHLIFLDFITRMILGEEYKSLSSSLCSFLRSLCFPIPLRPKYSQHYSHIASSSFLPHCERPCFAPIKNNIQNNNYVYFNR